MDKSILKSIIQYGVSGLLTLLGVIFTLVGLKGLIRGSKTSKVNAQIVQNGIETDATVTFADKNYSLLVNHKPIYSIVEYKYKDNSGSEHVRRIDNVPSDLVIRNNIVVGANIKVKYLQEDPKRSVMLMLP